MAPTSLRRSLGLTYLVVYFDKQTGAQHAVHWSKSFVFALKQVFSYFSVTNRKKKGKPYKNMEKHTIKVTKINILWWKLMEKVVLASKNDFDRQMACGAPICWSKYTTHRPLYLFYKALNNVGMMTIISGTLAVDTFFFLSGLLMAFLFLKQLQKVNRIINPFPIILHRYIR